MRPLIWVSKSMEKLAAALTEMGHPIGADTVRKELVRLGFAARFASGSVLLTRGKAEVQLGNCEQRIDATRRGALDPSYRHKCCVRGVSPEPARPATGIPDETPDLAKLRTTSAVFPLRRAGSGSG
jgi:hypothetical protein